MKCAEQLVHEKGGHLICVTPDTSIEDALGEMIAHHIGAILVREGKDIVGIWTERDLAFTTLPQWFESINGWFSPKLARIRDYMDTDLPVMPHTASVYELMDQFLGLRLRHMLIEKEGEYIGLLSIGDALKACLQEKDHELEALNKMVSWEYHEEWKWNPSKASSRRKRQATLASAG
jgi:CBS domain-containing protein